MDIWFNSRIVDKSITRAFKAQEAIAALAATTGLATDSNRNSWRQQPPIPTTPSDQASTISNLLGARSSGRYHFPYESAYRHLLFKLSVTPSPSGKLAVLSELVRLVVSYLTTFPAQPSSTVAIVSGYRIHSSKPSLGSDSVPLTPRGGGTGDELKTVSSKPSLTNLDLKRVSSNTGYGGNSPLMASAGKTHTSDHRYSNIGPNTDAIAGELRKIFRTNRAHCRTLFRDLQMIASFIPSHVLDLTDMGKAFWDVSLAVLSLKTEYLRVVVQTASELFEYSTHMLSPAMDIAFLSEWTLKDCAWLWAIAARVGIPEAQRELGIMNLSNPEITPLALMPFSKLAEVFSDENASGVGGGGVGGIGGGSSRHDERDKMDPVRMAVVKHWMGLAAAQGDLIAREYLEQNGFSGL
jgi:hypothetical protein